MKKVNWKSHKAKGALPKEEVAVLEKVILPFCQFLVQSSKTLFDVYDFGSWIEANYAHVKTRMSKVRKGDMKRKYPDKIILDIQNATYHLGNADNYWIETIDTGKRISPFIHNSEDLSYSLKSDWLEQIMP